MSETMTNEGADWIAAVYTELRQLAAYKMAQERPGQTLQPTALVHEAWMRVGGGAQPRWENKGHFFAAAGEAMRRILVERARRRAAIKRGGDVVRTELDGEHIAAPVPDDELMAVNEALERFAALHPEGATVAKLRYFVGLSMEDTAAAMGMSVRSTERLWAHARAWLKREVSSTR